jgi:hypothetical protein
MEKYIYLNDFRNGEEGMKENDGRSKFKYAIFYVLLRPFVNAITYPDPSQ